MDFHYVNLKRHHWIPNLKNQCQLWLSQKELELFSLFYMCHFPIFFIYISFATFVIFITQLFFFIDYVCNQADLDIIEPIKKIPCKPGKEQVVLIDDAFIDRMNMECLFQPNAFLNDQVINAYITLLRAQDHLKLRACGEVLLENSLISSILKRDGLSKTITQEDMTQFRTKLAAILLSSELNKRKGCLLVKVDDEEIGSLSDVEILHSPNGPCKRKNTIKLLQHALLMELWTHFYCVAFPHLTCQRPRKIR